MTCEAEDYVIGGVYKNSSGTVATVIGFEACGKQQDGPFKCCRSVCPGYVLFKSMSSGNIISSCARRRNHNETALNMQWRNVGGLSSNTRW